MKEAGAAGVGVSKQGIKREAGQVMGDLITGFVGQNARSLVFMLSSRVTGGFCGWEGEDML